MMMMMIDCVIVILLEFDLAVRGLFNRRGHTAKIKFSMGASSRGRLNRGRSLIEERGGESRTYGN